MKNKLNEQGLPTPTRTGVGQTGLPPKQKPQTPTTTSTIPEFLKNVDGVKKFQDWLDQNHPGWVPTGKLEKRGGYGRFGPKTTAAWNSYGEEYKKSGAATLSTPETGTGTEQSEEYKWFKENEQKGLFSGGKINQIKSGEWTYMKPASEIDDDPDGLGNYYFFKEGDWLKYQKTQAGKYVEVDSGDYKLPKRGIVSNEINEQIITSRRSASQKPTQATGTATTSSTNTSQSADSTKEEAFKNYRWYFNKIGILDDPIRNRPDENRVSAIYDGILSAIKKGYQSESFYFFKEGLKFLKSLYPNQYTELNPDEITTVVNVGNFIDYPEDSINQLRNPISRISEFKQVPIRDLISAFPSTTPQGRLAYIWPNLVTPEDKRSLTSMTSYFGEINDNQCAKALKDWYSKFATKDKIDANGAKIYKNYLMECNNKCKFVNKDEAFFNRMFKTGKEKSADRMIEELKSENAGVYNVPFADVKESCKRLGRETRVESKTAKNLKKVIKENLINEKNKKQRLLKETKIIKNRLHVLAEDTNKLKTQADYNKLFNSLISEANFLREQGFSEELIHESWFSFLGKLGFGGFADALQERLVQWVLETLKIPKTSYLANLLIVGFANFDLDNIGKILSGDCNTLVKFMAETLVEAFARKRCQLQVRPIT